MLLHPSQFPPDSCVAMATETSGSRSAEVCRRALLSNSFDTESACTVPTIVFVHVLQAVPAVDALVTALQQTGASIHDICSVLCTGRTLRLAVISSCSSCIQLRIQLQNLQTAVRIASWLSRNGHLLKSLELCRPSYDPRRGYSDLADVQDVLILGLQACHSKGSLWQLKGFSNTIRNMNSFPWSHRMLSLLPPSSLFSLRMDLSSMDFCCLADSYHLYCSALGQLRNLRDVKIKLPSRWPRLDPTELPPVEHAEGFLPGLAQLTKLTSLRLSHIEQQTLRHAHYLPPSLVQLRLKSDRQHQGPEEGWTCDLSHLTAVTSLDLNASLPPSTSLPSLTQQLVIRNPAAAHDLPMLTSSSAPIHTMCLNVEPSIGPQLATLAALSTVTELQLHTWFADGFDSMAPAWASLPMLRALVVQDYEGYNGDEDEDGPPLNHFVSPAVLSHLAATTSLTRLVFQRPLDEPPRRREEEVKGWCQHIAQLQQLRHLEFGGEYALGGSARHLAHLTQLTYLRISYSQVPDLVAVAFGCSLKGLVNLDLSGNQDLSDACAPALAQLTGLTSLRLADLPGFTEEGLQELSTLKKLQQLEVDEEDLAEGAVDWLRAAIRG